MGNLVRRDPLTEMMSGSWPRDIQQMMRSFAETFGGMESVTARASDWMPAADVFTRGDDYVIRMELPGIDPERDLEITTEDGTIRIRGERHEEEEEKAEGYIRRETSYGTFERAFRLPADVNSEDLKATHENGVLEIVVPGASKRPTQRVPVQVGKK